MNKTLRIVYILVFLVLCCTPLLIMPFVSPSGAVGKEDVAEKPSLIENGKVNENFGNEFDKWFTQQMPFRTEIITANNILSSDTLGKSANGVITGSDGWLFSEETVDDYIGVMPSERGIHNIAETLRIMQDYVSNHNADFVFTVAPDKNSIYPEYMPKGYIRSDKNTLTELEKYLKDYNINYVSLKNELLKQKENGQYVYLKCDTHWNNLGALYGYNAIMSSLGKDYQTFSGIDYSVKNDWYGDISKMLYPSLPKSCMQYYFDIDLTNIRFLQPRSSLKNDELMEELMSDREQQDTVIRTMNTKGKGSLYISRDSFGRAMLPFLTVNYRSAYITRYRSFNLTDIDVKHYDDVIYEIVERNLATITDNSPMIFAPQVEKVIGNIIRSDENNKIKIKKEGNNIRVYGLLDKSKLNDTSRIYISIKDGKNEKYYEAFPICEKELLNLSEKSDYGFTALIENVEKSVKTEDISVIIK